MTERKWTPGHRAADRMVALALISEAQRDGVAFLVNAETAAPEMYEALVEAQDAICAAYCPPHQPEGDGWPHVRQCDQLRALIAKARGET